MSLVGPASRVATPRHQLLRHALVRRWARILPIQRNVFYAADGTDCAIRLEPTFAPQAATSFLRMLPLKLTDKSMNHIACVKIITLAGQDAIPWASRHLICEYMLPTTRRMRSSFNGPNACAMLTAVTKNGIVHPATAAVALGVIEEVLAGLDAQGVVVLLTSVQRMMQSFRAPRPQEKRVAGGGETAAAVVHSNPTSSTNAASGAAPSAAVVTEANLAAWWHGARQALILEHLMSVAITLNAQGVAMAASALQKLSWSVPTFRAKSCVLQRAAFICSQMNDQAMANVLNAAVQWRREANRVLAQSDASAAMPSKAAPNSERRPLGDDIDEDEAGPGEGGPEKNVRAIDQRLDNGEARHTYQESETHAFTLLQDCAKVADVVADRIAHIAAMPSSTAAADGELSPPHRTIIWTGQGLANCATYLSSLGKLDHMAIDVLASLVEECPAASFSPQSAVNLLRVVSLAAATSARVGTHRATELMVAVDMLVTVLQSHVFELSPIAIANTLAALARLRDGSDGSFPAETSSTLSSEGNGPPPFAGLIAALALRVETLLESSVLPSGTTVGRSDAQVAPSSLSSPAAFNGQMLGELFASFNVLGQKNQKLQILILKHVQSQIRGMSAVGLPTVLRGLAQGADAVVIDMRRPFVERFIVPQFQTAVATMDARCLTSALNGILRFSLSGKLEAAFVTGAVERMHTVLPDCSPQALVILLRFAVSIGGVHPAASAAMIALVVEWLDVSAATVDGFDARSSWELFRTCHPARISLPRRVVVLLMKRVLLASGCGGPSANSAHEAASRSQLVVTRSDISGHAGGVDDASFVKDTVLLLRVASLCGTQSADVLEPLGRRVVLAAPSMSESQLATATLAVRRLGLCDSDVITSLCRARANVYGADVDVLATPGSSQEPPPPDPTNGHSRPPSTRDAIDNALRDLRSMMQRGVTPAEEMAAAAGITLKKGDNSRVALHDDADG